MKREIINCSKFDCSKKLVDTIFQLLDTIRANVTFFAKWLNPVNLWGSTGFEQFHFQSKKYQLVKLQLVDKGFGKCQQLDKIYSKENGVHVRQLGLGLGQVRLGQVRLGQVRLGWVRLGQVRLGQVYMYGSQVRCTCMAVRLFTTFSNISIWFCFTYSFFSNTISVFLSFHFYCLNFLKTTEVLEGNLIWKKSLTFWRRATQQLT